MNGDAVLKQCGKHLLDFCDDNLLTMGNALGDIVTGEYSRCQVANRKGTTVWDRTTIDYVLVDSMYAGDLMSLEFVENQDLCSDHKPMIAVYQAKATPVTGSTSTPNSRRQYKMNGRSDNHHARFENACEPLMVDVCAQATIAAATQSLDQASINL
jgi:hypothetical protein